ncbi:transporter substrate-binding domain-containing protein [Halarcobacter ebronensis]|uniref:histidine kinase n=1 Tax=Halarcobacter ebronensis TaxID=1462615 RepID=A0A4Q1AJI8_9BACT|nr:transporter substrate-binding domain-containing protein [Halarcobacter ebronensis]QKF81925.1 BvgS-like domain-containing two-component system sensor histidine kinase (PAS domain) [Halarcobacter ebronensis]RXK04356.1 hypothetical protein CRV07_11345 [Halarcobacter ebronensis]
MNNILKIIFILLIFIGTLYSSNTINLTEKEKEFLKNNSPIRVQNEMNWPPFNFNEDGIPKGFSVDYMNLLAKKLGVELEYITGPSWDEFMQMLQEDKLDAIINISKNKERKKSIAFTSIYHTAANAIYVKKGNEELNTLEKLKDKVLVMPKGFFAQKALEKYYPQIKQILVKDSLEALKYLSLGKADATIGKKNVLDYIITQNNISGILPTNYIDDNRMVSLIRVGVAKEKVILRDIIEKAQKSVSDKELLELKRKWFGTRDIERFTLKNFLNVDELSYISQKRVFNVCTREDLLPIEFVEDGKNRGIVIDILEKISNFTNMKFNYINVTSFNEASYFLKSGKCDIISTVTNENELNSFSFNTNSYLNFKLAIITQKNQPVVSSLNTILDKTVAVRDDSDLIPLLQTLNPNINILKSKNHRSTLDKVASGEAYFALEPLPIASYYISKFAMKNLYISRYTNLLYSVNMSVTKRDLELINIINKSLNMITEKEYMDTIDKWSTISFETIFDFTYFWEIVITLTLFITIFSYRHYILDKLNRDLKKANEVIEKKTIELAKQKMLFETLYYKSADGVILITNGIFTDCNESILKILKLNKNEIINSTLEDISPILQPNNHFSKELVHVYIEKTLKDGVIDFEWVLTDGTHKNIWTEIVLTAIEIENKKVIHAVIRDITNRKILEQKLEDLNLNLEKRVEEEIKKNEINTQQLIQQNRLAQMGEMISMIAHQWRQPLSAIAATTNNLVLKMIIDDNLDRKYFEKELKLITNYSQYLSSTIDDFRNFFKSDKEKVEFELKDIIEKSISIIKTSMESNEIKIDENIEDEIYLYSYPSELQQVILNILKNAEDALCERKGKNRKIFISTLKEKNKVVISILDNGGGIDKNIIDKIFDPYFSTKNKKDGTGLGLYMSKIIINEHCKGSLKVSNYQNGALFSIELPYKES